MLYIYIMMLKIKYFDKNISPDITEQIIRSIAAFEERYRTSVTIHAMSGIWYRQDSTFLFPRWVAHRSEYCRQNRYSRRKYNKLCLQDCAAGVEKEALRSGKPFLHDCWKGVRELIVPFLWGDMLELVFYIGPFRGGEPPVEMQEHWESLPEFPMEEYCNMVQDVWQLGYSFYAQLLQEKQQKYITPNRCELIRAYIHRYSDGEITLDGLAEYLGVSPSRASHLCTALLGVSFQEQVMNIRLKKAESLLKETDEPIKEIACRAGFSNVYYFSRVFRKFFGYPPGAVRKEKRGNLRKTS